jgi:hypothetical protein
MKLCRLPDAEKGRKINVEVIANFDLTDIIICIIMNMIKNMKGGMK